MNIAPHFFLCVCFVPWFCNGILTRFVQGAVSPSKPLLPHVPCSWRCAQMFRSPHSSSPIFKQPFSVPPEQLCRLCSRSAKLPFPRQRVARSDGRCANNGTLMAALAPLLPLMGLCPPSFASRRACQMQHDGEWGRSRVQKEARLSPLRGFWNSTV